MLVITSSCADLARSLYRHCIQLNWGTLKYISYKKPPAGKVYTLVTNI